MAELTEKARRLMTDPNYLFFATVNSDGSPQVTPVWVDVDDNRMRVNTAIGRIKERNTRRDPRIAASITSREDPWDKVDIRGRVVDFVEGEEAERHIDSLSKKYIGQDPYPFRAPGERRIMLVIEVDRVHEM